jgi:hypothetical protein
VPASIVGSGGVDDAATAAGSSSGVSRCRRDDH